LKLRNKIILGAIIFIIVLGIIGLLSGSPIDKYLDELKTLEYRTVSDDWTEYRQYLPTDEGMYYEAEDWDNFLEMVEDGYGIWDKKGVGYSFTIFYDEDIGVIWFEILRSMTEGTSAEGHVIVGYFTIS